MIYVTMLTVSYVHSLAKHRSPHQMRSRREIRQEPVVIGNPEVLVRKRDILGGVRDNEENNGVVKRKKKKCNNEIFYYFMQF